MDFFNRKLEADSRNYPYLSPWLDQLPYDWTELEGLGTVRRYKKHEAVFHSNDPVKYVYLVKSGRVRLYLLSDSGEEKAIAIIGKNGLLGESSVFLDQEYFASAITAIPTTLIRVAPEVFRQKILDCPLYSEQLFHMMSIKIRLLYQHSVHLSYNSSFYRVCHTLAQLGLTYGEMDKSRIKLKVLFTQQELANLIGATRVTVANHIKKLS
jgi:CRP/FNR family cyclic AMP-dependent transcriptional regulator